MRRRATAPGSGRRDGARPAGEDAGAPLCRVAQWNAGVPPAGSAASRAAAPERFN
jgi:hypothetical protein